MISPEQKRKKEEARQQAIENSKNVCADGERHAGYTESSNQINNE